MQRKGRLSEYFGRRLRDAKAGVAMLDPDELLEENQEVLVSQLLGRCMPERVAVDWSAATSSAVEEARVLVEDPFQRASAHEVPASRVVVTVPVTGTWQMLEFDAMTSTWSPFDGVLRDGKLIVEVKDRQLTKAKIDSTLGQVRDIFDRRCEWANLDLSSFAKSADQTLRSELAARKKRVLDDRALEASLSIPITPTDRPAPPVPARRKVVSLPKRRSQAQFVPEPVLDGAMYEDVIHGVVSWARALERTPRTARKLDEEELRDLLLGNLNTYWQGAAGGELFNGHGKTDILIREQDRSVFIAECKIWSGGKAAGDAIGQLLNYLVWRDSKAALIVFIRNKRPAEAIAKLLAAVESHPSHVLSRSSGNTASRSDFVLAADDEGRRIELAVLPVVIGAR